MRNSLSLLAAVSLIAGSSVLTARQTTTTTPPCESAPPTTTPPPPTTAKPAAPTNLRIVGGAGDDWESDLEILSGPNAGRDEEGDLALAAQVTTGPHAYYFALASRSDCVAAYSLRNAAQVEQYRRTKSTPPAVFYLYPNDPDPREQDAMKIVIPANLPSLPTQVWVPLGAHAPKNLMVSWEFWWGREFEFANTGIDTYKGLLQFDSPAGSIWTSLHSSFRNALPDSTKAPLPPGGPFVTMMYPHASAAVEINTAAGTTRGGANALLPYNVANTQKRGYGSEALGPRDTSVVPGGAEWGVVAETWTRYWAFFERDPATDWTNVGSSGPMQSYKLTVWAADANRGPLRIINELRVAPSQGSPGGWTSARIEMNVSASQAAWDRIAAGRGALVAYARNIVSLHGTSRAGVEALIQKPLM